MAIESIEEDNPALKLILAGGGILYGVMSVLAFAFAVVAWRIIGASEMQVKRWDELMTD